MKIPLILKSGKVKNTNECLVILIPSICYSEKAGVFTGRRENLIHPLGHSEERIMRRENLILYSINKKESKRREPHARKEARAQGDAS